MNKTRPGWLKRSLAPVYVLEKDDFRQEVKVWDYATFMQEREQFAELVGEYRRRSIEHHQQGGHYYGIETSH